MRKSLNPNATENRDAPQPTQPASATTDNPAPRRNFLAAVAAGLVGFVLSIFPLAAGALTILDPLFSKKKSTGNFIRVASLDSIPDDGLPVRVPIVADLTDAWNREPNQPVGAVYLRRIADDKGGPAKIIAFNAICPHAGCSIGLAKDHAAFQCPCHTSTFHLDGSRIEPSPSPRNMDELKVDADRLAKTGEVWVDFVNYYPGKAAQVPKA